jgi:SAM-dependent methyltransferase
MMDGTTLDALATRHELTYHHAYCRTAEAEVGFRGKRVLEVGGSLPRDYTIEGLGASQWVCIQEPGYFKEVRSQGFPDIDARAIPMAALTDPEQLGDYRILLGRIEDLPACLHGRFDVVFSIAAFEHIHTLGRALELIAAALAPHGRLFTMFSPLWSAYDGHHLPQIVDKAGNTFDFSSSPIPPWGHLLMRPSTLYHHLLNHTDAATAADIIYYTYHSPHINRLFVEDYADYISKSPLQGTVVKTFRRPIPPDVQARLEALYPGRHHFDNNGLKMVLERK